MSRDLHGTDAGTSASNGSGTLVSVAIPAFNAEATLAQAIDSVLAQTHRPLELIVVDDGSTDGTWKLIESYGAALRAIRQPHGGIAAARNAGVQAAQGDFIALMDHDDVCEPQRLAVQLRFLRQHPEVLLCGSEFGAFDARGTVAAAYSKSRYSRCSAHEDGALGMYPTRGALEIGSALGGSDHAPAVVKTASGPVCEEMALGCFVHPPTVMFRRSVLEQAGLFDERAGLMCDWDWLVKVARVGDIGHIDLPLLRFRLSPTPISATPQGRMDTVRAAHLIVERDPALVPRHAERVRALFGSLYADAAYALADEQPAQALALLARSALQYRRLTGQTPRTLLRILMPRAVLARRKRR